MYSPNFRQASTPPPASDNSMMIIIAVSVAVVLVASILIVAGLWFFGFLPFCPRKKNSKTAGRDQKGKSKKTKKGKSKSGKEPVPISEATNSTPSGEDGSKIDTISVSCRYFIGVWSDTICKTTSTFRASKCKV